MTVPAPRTGPALRLSDIAGQAAVSEATVSRVLNGKPGVADTTRQRVLAALDILGYERPVRLRQRSAGLIGLVTPELTNPIFPAFAQSVEQVLAGHGYTPVLCTQLPGGATEDELVEQLVERGVGGIVFLSGLHADTSADPARYAALTERGVPFVLINGYNERISAPFVSPDDQAAVRMAVSHLAELGHRRIGLAIGPQRYVPSAGRPTASWTRPSRSWAWTGRRPNSWCARRCSASRAARSRRAPCSTAAAPASCAAAT